MDALAKVRRAAWMVLLAAPAWAQAPSGPQAPEEPGSMGIQLVRTLLVLGAVVLCIYLVLNVGLRRLMGLNRLVGGRGEMVRVLERTPLEPKRSLYVVEAAGEYLLVGAAEGGLTLLAKLDAAEVQRLKAEKGSKTAFRQGGSPPPPPSA